MEFWNALAGVGAVGAVGVAVWAVIVARHANRIAKESAPPRLPIIEGQHLGRDLWRFTNVGTAPMHDAVIIEFLDGTRNGDSGDPVLLEPGGQIEIQSYVQPPYRQICIRGHELRGDTKVERFFALV